MLKTWKSAMTIALACSLAVWFSFPMQAAVETNLTQIIPTKFPVIECYVFVRDDTGSVVPNLDVENFKITEQSSLEDQPIEESPIDLDYVSFYSGTTFALLIDCSGSMRGQPLIDAKNAASTFIDTNLLPEDRAAIVSFGSPAQFHAPPGFTSDKATLLDGIDPLAAGGSTALYGAIHEAVTKINEETGIKAIIVFTDGKSEGDTHTKDQAIELAKSSNVPVYTIALGNEDNADILKEIAAETGGYYSYAPTASNLEKIYNDIAEKARGQYLLTYTTHNPNYDDTTRTVTVEATVGADTDEDTGTYIVPSPPKITLHDDTMDLMSQSQIDPIPRGSSFEIKAWVEDDVSVQMVRLFYRTTGSSSAYNEDEMSLTADGHYQFAIPGTAVTSPGLDFYITASDGTSTSTSPPNTPAFFPHQIAILPNHFPVITHTPVTQVKEGEPITIEAQIADPDAGDQVEAWLYWRKSGHILFHKNPMENPAGDYYESTIPAERVTKPGIDYYLMAADTHEARAYHGSDTKPHHIVINGLFSFEDTFDLRPRPEWDITDGHWTVINGEFTPLETGKGKWYQAKLDVPRLANCTIETDVYLASRATWARPPSGATVAACESGEDSSHTVRLILWGTRNRVDIIEIWSDDYKISSREVSYACPVHVKLSISNSIITGYVNDEQVGQFFDPQYQGVSQIQLRVSYGEDGDDRTTFDNFLVEEMP